MAIDKPVQVWREIYVSGQSSVDGRALHSSMLEQLYTNTKLMLDKAGFVPLILPDHPDGKAKNKSWTEAKSMGLIRDVKLKTNEDGTLSFGGLFEFNPEVEYTVESYPNVSGAWEAGRILPSGETIGVHLDHVAVMGNKHVAFPGLKQEFGKLSEMWNQFSSLFKKQEFVETDKDTPKEFECDPKEYTKKEYTPMDPKALEQIMAGLQMAMDACKAMAGGGAEKPVDEEMAEDKPKDENEMGEKEEYAEDKEEEKKKESEYTQLRRNQDDLTMELISTKAEALGIPKSHRKDFEDQAMLNIRNFGFKSGMEKVSRVFSSHSVNRSELLANKNGDYSPVNGGKEQGDREEKIKKASAELGISKGIMKEMMSFGQPSKN